MSDFFTVFDEEPSPSVISRARIAVVALIAMLGLLTAGAAVVAVALWNLIARWV